MKKKRILLAMICVLALAFFFFVPLVPVVIDPCAAGGKGFGSLSFYVLTHGEVYMTTSHYLYWAVAKFRRPCF